MKFFAFMKKDFLITISYRFAIFLRFGGMFVSLLMLYYIGKTFSGNISPYLSRYGGNYFPYVLVGMSVSSFVTVGLGALAREVRSAQVEGTLEALLSTPTSIYTILIGNSLWTFIMALIHTLFFLVLGVLFLKLTIMPAQAMFGFLILILTFAAFLSIGMLSAAFIMIFKQGNPIQFIFGTSSYFLGGVLFPVEILPGPFQFIAAFLPISHAVKAIRELLLARVEIYEIFPLIFKLVIFIVIVTPVSIMFFQYAVKRAKRDGSLVQY
ncbi:MAG: ABC transporter permease [Candidatus Latescibacteria bacterium]|nr:ABC transporter permease [Candidatus Latescibacterota bacterium]